MVRFDIDNIENLNPVVQQSLQCEEVQLVFSLKNSVKNKIATLCKLLAQPNAIRTLYMDFTAHNLAGEDIDALASLLRSEHCPASITVILTKVALQERSLATLSAIISKGCQAKEVNFDLCDNNLGDSGAKLFADALQSAHCLSKISLNLAKNNIRDEGFIALAQAISTNSNAKDISLNLLFNPAGEIGARALVNGMYCSQYKTRLALKYEFYKHGTPIIVNLANVLKSSKCPSNLALWFGCSHLSIKEIEILFSALQSMQVSCLPELDLSEQNLQGKGLKVILDSLESVNENITLKLNLEFNHIKLDGAEALADFIRSGKIKSTIHLHLGQNSFGGKAGMQLIRDAIVKNPDILTHLIIHGPAKELDVLYAAEREKIRIDANNGSGHSL